MGLPMSSRRSVERVWLDWDGVGAVERNFEVEMKSWRDDGVVRLGLLGAATGRVISKNSFACWDNSCEDWMIDSRFEDV